MIQEKYYDFTVIFFSAKEGGFTVSVPALPGCFTEGNTLEEAQTNAKDAIRTHIESLRMDGEEIPSEINEFISRIRINAIPA